MKREEFIIDGFHQYMIFAIFGEMTCYVEEMYFGTVNATRSWMVLWPDGRKTTHYDYPSIRRLMEHGYMVRNYPNAPAGKQWKRVKENEIPALCN